MTDYRTQSLAPADENMISRYREVIPKTRIALTLADSDAGRRMSAFCDRLLEIVPTLSVLREAAEGDDLSAIHPAGNIHFYAIPSGKLLEHFLFCLLGSDTLKAQDMGIAVADVRHRIAYPAVLKVYVAAGCPYCPQALSRAMFLAGTAPDKIDLHVIDAQLFPEKARTDGVRSVPLTLLDNRFRWTGLFEIHEIVDVMADRDPTQLSADTLEKMLTDGNAETVARLMDEANVVIPGFIDLLAHEKWSVRLGAMVAFEYLAESNAAVSNGILDSVWERFPNVGDDTRGDILHLIGIIGGPNRVALLETVESGPYADSVKEVAREIIQSLKNNVH